MLAMHLQAPLRPTEILAAQADYVSAWLRRDAAGRAEVVTDWNNALKLGYDVQNLCYPDWLVGEASPLGRIVEGRLPGWSRQAPGGPVGSQTAAKYGLPPTCQVVAGTTDSIAAFIAAGGVAAKEGTGVTSLGTTLALKLRSAVPVEDADRGIYSHRLGDAWLVGGASNVGAGALADQGYTDMEEVARLMEKIDPARDVDLDYYPLVGGQGGGS
ncbi:unnamed protein product, partial [Heterosigma akashiwo]